MLEIIHTVPWYVFALVGALLVAVAALLEKSELTQDEPLHFSAGASIIGAVISLPLLPFIDFSTITSLMLWIVLGMAILGTTSFSIVSFAIQRLGVGETSALLALTPVITAVFSAFLLGEWLSFQAIIGILLAVGGLVFLESRRFSLPLHHWIGKNGYLVMLVLLAVLIYAFSTVTDRYLLKSGMSPLSLIALAQIIMGLIFVALALLRPSSANLAFSSIRRHGWKVVGFAVIMFISRLFYAQSVLMAYAAFASAIKRSGALFTTLFAGVLFKEKHLGRTLVAMVLIVGGALLIIFSK